MVGMLVRPRRDSCNTPRSGSNGNNGSDGYKAGGRAAAAGGTLLGAPSVRFPKRQLLASDHCSWKPRSPLHTSWWSASWRFPGAAAAASAARHFQQGGVPPLQAGKQPKMHGVSHALSPCVWLQCACKADPLDFGRRCPSVRLVKPRALYPFKHPCKILV